MRKQVLADVLILGGLGYLCRITTPKNTGLLSNQGEKSINFYFIRVPLRKKVLKYGTPKPRKTSLNRGVLKPETLKAKLISKPRYPKHVNPN